MGGTLRCEANCRLNTADCVTAVCGDGKADGSELCDGDDLGGYGPECAGQISNALGGVLKCGPDCGLDVSECRLTKCGDGVIEGLEECEGSNLGAYAGKTCADLPFGTSIFLLPVNYQSGNLGCSNCELDRSACVPAPGCYLTVAPKVPPIFCL